MSQRLPPISGRELIRALERLGYVVVRQRGSHVRLRHADAREHRPTSVPLHRELTRGTLMSILGDAGITLRELSRLR